MALMEDTGWWVKSWFQCVLIFSKSGIFRITPWPRSWSGERYLPESWFLFILWIQGLGCDFALKSCKDWMESRARKGLSIHPYCNKVTIEICSAVLILLWMKISRLFFTQCFWYKSPAFFYTSLVTVSNIHCDIGSQDCLKYKRWQLPPICGELQCQIICCSTRAGLWKNHTV